MAMLGKSETNITNAGRKYYLTPHAMQMIDVRGISLKEIHDAMESGSRRKAIEPNREVIRHGELRLVVENHGEALTILTVMYAGDFS